MKQPIHTQRAVAARSARTALSRLHALCERRISADLLALCARLAIASIFFLSGRTKVDGWLTLTPAAVDLFATEYRVPLLEPLWAAQLATLAEHLFPLLLLLGLGTRAAAAALLAMTAVIQLFVYPDAWSTHLSWATLMLLLIGRGGGRWSLDQLLARGRSRRLGAGASLTASAPAAPGSAPQRSRKPPPAPT